MYDTVSNGIDSPHSFEDVADGLGTAFLTFILANEDQLAGMDAQQMAHKFLSEQA